MADNQILTKKQQIKQDILTGIHQGRYSPGEKLMGEAAWASELGVAPGTLRRVIVDLATEKVLLCLPRKGTYVNPHYSQTIEACVQFSKPGKVKDKHFWGKLVECADRSLAQVRLRRTYCDYDGSTWDRGRIVANAFSNDKQHVGTFAASMHDLPWLAEGGFCTDLTDRFDHWTQVQNLHPMALDAVRWRNRMVALPWLCSLSTFSYHKGAFECAGLDAQEATHSLDGLIRAVEKVARLDGTEHSFYSGSTYFLVMHLLRAFYDKLNERFNNIYCEPIEREIAVEVLRIVHLLKWQLGGLIFMGNELDFHRHRPQMRTDLAVARIPIALSLISPTASLVEGDAKSQRNIGSLPFAWGNDHRPFSLFNCSGYIISSRIDEVTCDFFWRFLTELVTPQSVYELQRRYAEEGIVYDSAHPFVTAPARIPKDHEFEQQCQEYFEIAESEIHRHVPAFEYFVFAANRMLFDSEANPEKEYEFYLASIGRTVDLDGGAVSTAHRVEH